MIAPKDVIAFLRSRGWRPHTPDKEHESMWFHGSKHVLMKWEQAVAIETVEFLTLGGPNQR